MTGYVRAGLYSFQHKKKDHRIHHIPGHNPSMGGNNKILSDKAPADQLYGNNQKRLQKIVGGFFYYAIAIDPKMLMALNSLTAVRTKPTIETAKQITQFLNYSATNPDVVTEHRRSGIILHLC